VPSRPWCQPEQPEGEQPDEMSQLVAAALLQILGKALSAVPGRCPLLRRIPTSSAQPSEPAAQTGQVVSLDGSADPGRGPRSGLTPSKGRALGL